MISIRTDLLGLERVLRYYQTDIYAPEEPNQAPHNHAPVDRNNSEVQQRHQGPELQARCCEWPESLHTIVSSFPFLDSRHTETYSLAVAYNGLSVLALEGTHYRNEQQCVDSRSQCLVQGKFFGCVGFAEPFLSIKICRVCRKLLF